MSKVIDTFPFLLLTCIDAPLEKVWDILWKGMTSDRHLRWKKWNDNFDHRHIRIGAPSHPEYPSRLALWEPNNAVGRSAFIGTDDGRPGLAHQLGVRHRIAATYVAISNNENIYAKYALYHYDKHSNQRVLQALRSDTRWEFYSDGPPLPFERLEYYRRRRVTERLNREIILEYLLALGWDIQDPRFWESERPAWYAEFVPTKYAE